MINIKHIIFSFGFIVLASCKESKTLDLTQKQAVYAYYQQALLNDVVNLQFRKSSHNVSKDFKMKYSRALTKLWLSDEDVFKQADVARYLKAFPYKDYLEMKDLLGWAVFFAENEKILIKEGGFISINLPPNDVRKYYCTLDAVICSKRNSMNLKSQKSYSEMSQQLILALNAMDTVEIPGGAVKWDKIKIVEDTLRSAD